MKSRTKKRLVALGVVLVVLAGGAFGLRQFQKSQRAALIQAAREQGMAAYDAGDWHAALEHLAYYRNRSTDPDGQALYRLADARRRIPEDDRSHITLALRIATDAEAADPDNLDARLLLVNLYSLANRPTEALSTLERAIQRSPDDRRLRERRVELLRQIPNWSEAKAEALEIVKAHPDDVEAHLLYISTLLGEGGARAEAERRAHLDHIDQITQPGATRHVLRAQVLLSLGTGSDLTAAWKECQDAIAAGLTSGLHVGLTLDAMDVLVGINPPPFEPRQAIVDAIAAVEQAALAGEPVPEDVGIALVLRRYRLAMVSNVEQALPGVLARPSEASERAIGWALVAGNPSAEWAEAAEAALGARRGDEAAFWLATIGAVRAMQDRDPAAADLASDARSLADMLPQMLTHERALASYLLGGARQARGAHAEAEAAFDNAMRVPRWRVATISQLSLLLEQGRYTKAQEVYASIVRGSDPQFALTVPGIHLLCEILLAEAERSLEPHPAGMEASTMLAVLAEHSRVLGGRYLGLLARARAAGGDVTGATDAVDQMLDLGDELDVRHAIGTGNALHRRAPELADRLLAEATRREPLNPFLIFVKVQIAVEAGRVAEAQKLLADGIAASRGDARLNLQILQARLDAQRDVGEKLATFRAMAEEHPDSLGVHRALLETEAAWADEAVVRTAIARLRAIAGESSTDWRLFEARRLLTFAASQQRASEALTVLQPVLSSGTQPSAYRLAAGAWTVLGRRGEAILALERAVAAGSSPVTVYPQLITLLVADGRAAEAQDRARAFVAVGAVSAEATRTRARLLETLELWDEAIADRTRLAEMGDRQDRIDLASLLVRAGRLERAAAMFDELLGSGEPTPQLIAAAANLRGLQGDVEGGAALFDRLSPDVSPGRRIMMLADYLAAAEQPERARDVVAAHSRTPEGAADPEVWLWLARAAFQAGDLQAGNQAISAGLQRNPDSGPLKAVARLVADGVTDHTVLASLAGVAGTDNLDPVVREFNDLLVQYARDQITPESFESRLVEFTRANPTYYRAWNVLVRLRLVRGNIPGAADAASEAMRVIPGDPRPARDAADMFAQQGQYARALSAARAWRDRMPADPMDADLYIAELHMVMDAPGDAAVVLAPWKPVILGSQSPTAAQAGVVAVVIAATGTPAERTALLERAADQPVWATACINAADNVPDSAQRRAWLERLGVARDLSDGDVLTLAGQWRLLGQQSGQSQDLEIALELGSARPWPAPLAGDATLHRARVLHALGRFDEAAREFRSVIGADPVLAREGRMGLVLMAGDVPPQAAASFLADGRALWEDVRTDRTLSAEARTAAGEAVAKLFLTANQPREAAAVIDQALAILPGSDALRSQRIAVLVLAGDRDAATQAIDDIDAREGKVRAMLGAAASIAASHPESAEWLYRRAHELNNDNYFASNNLADHLLAHGGDASEAAMLAQQAIISVRSRDPRPELLATIGETLGRALLASGRSAEAEAAFREALRYEPANPALLLGLADALHTLERTAEARDALSRISAAQLGGFSDAQRRRYDELSESLNR